ncbi:MAG: hypothetical protein V2A61_04010, partial [Calditrichota bacterium]
MKLTDKSLFIEQSPHPPVRWWHWTMGLSLVVLFTLLTPRSKSPEFAHLVEGSVSQTKIIAPFDFEVLKSSDELDKERRESAETILPVTLKSDSVGDFYTRELLLFADESHSMLADLPHSELNVHTPVEDETLPADTTETKPETIGLLAVGRDQLFRQFGFRLGQDTWDFLIRLYRSDRSNSPGVYFRFFENILEKVLRDIYGQG